MILIPLCGKGERFKKAGFTEPKALIKVNEKEIIFHLLDNLNILKETIFIIYGIEYIKYNFEKIILKKYPSYNFKFLSVDFDTKGAAETLKIGLETLEKDIPILSLDSDNFYLCDILNTWNGENKVFYFIDKGDPIFSYLNIMNGKITDISEKNKISNIACCGAYGFRSSKKLLKYCNKIIKENKKTKDEFYISRVIKEMIIEGEEFLGSEILNKDYFTLGTPENIKKHENSILFDLDGTLVKTDDIYSSVWKDILSEYNISVDDKFFENFIQGRSDSDFLRFLIPEINEDKIIELSTIKDEKFIEKLKKNSKEILVPGVLEFIDYNKNSFMGIVTSCNKNSAKFLMKYTGLEKYINLLVSSEDCKKHKPNPEPYIKAMDLLNINCTDTFIFEDSISGYLSAKGSGSEKIILIKNKKNEEIETLKIENYFNFKLVDPKKANDYSEEIKRKLLDSYDIIYLKKLNENLKTGYICDIQKYKLKLCNEELNLILKINNFDNELSKTAEKLNLYNNEIYFYENLKNSINVSVPKFYGTILKKGLIIEDLNYYKGSFNINLSKNIKLLLRVIEDISSLHSRFMFTSENNIPSTMKNLKKINQIYYYKELVKDRFCVFIEKNKRIIDHKTKKLFEKSYLNFDENLNRMSSFPLSFCHGDLKSPNIFYKNNSEPFYLDWQYIHLNKGISDIAFLLVESLDFDPIISDLVLKFYFKISGLNSFKDYLEDFKISLQIFPFFVMIWFNSEDSEKILDKSFPIKFMKNLIKYYIYYLN